MDEYIPDGDYDIDFSGLLRARRGDFFGMKFGFKPDTIDETQPSQLYIEDDNWYLSSNSKVYKNPTATSLSQEDIYFEGKCSQSITPIHVQKQGSSGLNILETNLTSQVNELCLSFDPVLKSFQVNPIDGYVKMNKSRETQKIQHKVSKYKKQKEISESPFFLDAFLERIQIQHKKIMKSPIKLADHIKSHRKEAAPSYNQILSKLSPVRRNTPTFPNISSPSLNSPTFFIPSPTASISSPTRSPPPSNSSKSTSLSSTQEKNTLINNGSPISVPTNHLDIKSPKTPKVTKPNGGTGTNRTQKSLLLRKAERAIGISNSATPKFRMLDKSPALATKKSVNKTPILTKRKEVKGKELPIEIEKKEAKSDQTAFELILPPPEKNRDINEFKPLVKTNTNNKINNGNGKDSDEEHSKEKKDNIEPDLPIQDVEGSDDFEMDLSDWEDTDAIDAATFLPDGLVTNFNLIIEDDPFKNKKDDKAPIQLTTVQNQPQKEVSNKVNQSVKARKIQKESVEMKQASSSNSIDNEQELDAELDRVFDDIQFDDEMSEEE